jgi:exopolysaccharide biosynthesis polyprenyl glycosylphosphotransferase
MMAVILALVEMGSIFAAACAIVFVGLRPVLTSSVDVAAALVQAFVLSLSCVIAFYLNDLYDLRMVPSFARFASQLPRSLSFALILLAGFYLLLPPSTIAEGRLIWSGLIGFGLVLPLRAVSYAVIRSRPFLEHVLILGTGPLASKLIEEIETQPHRRYTIVGVVDEGTALRESPFRYFLAGTFEQLGKIVDLVRPHRIIVALTERRGRLPVDQLVEAQMRRIVVEDGVEAYERLTGKLAIEALSPSDLIFSRDLRKSRFGAMVGQVLSLFAALAGLIGLAPLFGLIALAIKLDSRGPVFFVQERVGQWERPFKLIKFRTMHPCQEKTSEWEWDNLDRVTRVGKWLRKFRLDELPQFVNILRGDMNIVGPRPHPVSNFDLFVAQIPLYSFRAMVRPGLTGWAQIRYGYANNLDEETEKMRYDLYYMKHMSLWFDLRILFDTVKIALSGRQTGPVDGFRTAPGADRRRQVHQTAASTARIDRSVYPALGKMLDVARTGNRPGGLTPAA